MTRVECVTATGRVLRARTTAGAAELLLELFALVLVPKCQRVLHEAVPRWEVSLVPVSSGHQLEANVVERSRGGTMCSLRRQRRHLRVVLLWHRRPNVLPVTATAVQQAGLDVVFDVGPLG